MKILFFGRPEGNTNDRGEALKRLGHDVKNINARELLPKNRIVYKFLMKTGGLGYGPFLWKKIKNHLGNEKFDCVFFNQENYLTFSTTKKIQHKYGNIIQYINDDPFNGKRKIFWRSLLKSIPRYTLTVVVRKINVNEAYQYEARNVVRVFMAADDRRHAKPNINFDEKDKYESDVVFIGTCFENRGPFLSKIISSNIGIKIYGNGWENCDEWENIKNNFIQSSVVGEEYAKTLAGAKIALCLLSKNNRDEYTTRSMEIPSVGSFLLAERTHEHSFLYKEGLEAEYFSDINECIEKIHLYLNCESKRTTISENGHKKFLKNKHTVIEQMNVIIKAYEKITT